MAKKRERRAITHQVGNSNRLTEVTILQEQWGMTRRSALSLLRTLRIPVFHVGNEGFFNFHTFEKVIFYLTRFGGPGFAAPGSVYKEKDKYKNPKLGTVSITLTDEDIENMKQPLFIAEFMSCGPRNNKPGAINTLIKQLKGAK